MQDLEDEGIALELAVHQGQRVRTKAMVPLPLGRVIEERITTLESLRDAKHWLGVIARAEEADYIDLSTVKVRTSLDDDDHLTRSPILSRSAQSTGLRSSLHTTYRYGPLSYTPSVRTQGHKRIMMIQDIRDEVDNALGMGSWQEFLHTLIDVRSSRLPLRFLIECIVRSNPKPRANAA